MRLIPVAGLVVFLLASSAQAVCRDGATASCTVNGCVGERTCYGNIWSPCESLGYWNCTVCGRTVQNTCNDLLTPSHGVCRASEICNACDDDADGIIDDGLYKCEFGPFTQATCSPTTPVVIPYSFTAPGTVPPALLDAVTTSSLYANNLDHRWLLFANGNVTRVVFKGSASRNSVLPSGDFISLAGQTFPNGTTLSASVSTSVGGVIQDGAFMRFFSDSATGGNVGIEQAEVYCDASFPNPPVGMQQSVRHEGLLLAANDTLFFTINGGPEDIFIWTTGATGDADLYLRTGAIPTKDTYNQRSIGTTSNEAIRIRGNTTGQTHFVAVTSRSGPLAFGLRYSRAKANNIWTQNVGLNFNASPSEIATISTMVKDNMLKYFGASEGQVVVDSVTIYNNTCSCNGICNVCVNNNNNDGAHCTAGSVFLYAEEWDGADGDDNHVLAHEWGHCITGFLDEYRDHNLTSLTTCSTHQDSLCGHSIMSSFYLNNFCTPLNHKSDTAPPLHVCSTCGNTKSCTGTCANCPTRLDSNWGALNPLVNAEETLTPDDDYYFRHEGLSALFSVTVH